MSHKYGITSLPETIIACRLTVCVELAALRSLRERDTVKNACCSSSRSTRDAGRSKVVGWLAGGFVPIARVDACLRRERVCRS